MENIILTNNKDLRLVSVKVGVLSTLRFELPLVSASATHVEVIVTSGDVHSAYTATFIDATKRWQCDIADSQFPTVGKQSYEVAYVLDGKQFWDGKGWIEIEDATTSGIEPQPRPEPYRYVVVSVNGYGADAQGAVRIPKTFIATDSPTTTEGYMEGDIYFNRETGATWTLCNVQGTLTWVFNYKNYYTKAETDEAIDRVAAYYITYDAAGNPFPTYAALANATTVYSGGKVRVPTRNDYCVVLADETHQGAEYRYIYAVAEGQTTGSWQPQFPVEGVMTVDQTVTKNSQNPVSGGGVWSAIWGMATTTFSSLYDWCVAQIAKLRDKLDLNVYGYGNPVASFADGFSVADSQGGGSGQRYTAPSGGETITFVGPVPSSNPYLSNYKFYYPSTLGTLDSFDPDNYSVWCLVCPNGGTIPSYMMYKTGPYYYIGSFNSATPTLTLGIGEATGDAPTMARPLGATGDTLAKVSQIPAVVAPSTSSSASGKAAEAKATGDALAGKLGNSQTTPDGTATLSFIAVNDEPRLRMTGAAGEYIDITFSALRFQIPGFQEFVLSLPMESGLLALTSAIPYALVTKTITNGAVSLDDRAINAVAVSSSLASLTVNFPTATSGKARDFGLRLTVASGITTAPELALPQGVTCENADGEAPEIGADGAATILYFTETAAGVFLVKGEVVTAIS